LLGLNIKDFMAVGYAYEFANTLVDGVPDGTHEIQLKIHIGKPKDYTKRVKVIESGNRNARFYSDGGSNVFQPSSPVEKSDPESTDFEEEATSDEYFQEEMDRGYYVILKDFKSFEEAYSYWAQIINDYGYKASFGYTSTDDQYYVYLFNSEDYQETEIELEKAKLLELFEDAYSLKID